MSIFNLQDITTAGAYCNALKSVTESDHRAKARQGSPRQKARGWLTPVGLMAVAGTLIVTLSIGLA